MPVAGLPKVLENTLTSILDTYDIRTWSIFAEENGEISLRIKFNMADLQSNDMGAHSQECINRICNAYMYMIFYTGDCYTRARNRNTSGEFGDQSSAFCIPYKIMAH